MLVSEIRLDQYLQRNGAPLQAILRLESDLISGALSRCHPCALSSCAIYALYQILCCFKYVFFFEGGVTRDQKQKTNFASSTIFPCFFFVEEAYMSASRRITM